MSEAWNTKYGPRRVRHDPPTLQEAIFAAKGLTDSLQAQAEIAASLMGLPVESVRAEVLKSAPDRTASTRAIAARAAPWWSSAAPRGGRRAPPDSRESAAAITPASPTAPVCCGRARG